MQLIYLAVTGFGRGNMFNSDKQKGKAVDVRFNAAFLTCALLGILFASSACSVGGNPFRGVGAAAKPGPEITQSIMTESVTEPEAPEPVSAAETEKTAKEDTALQKGTAVNVAASAKAPELALVEEEIPPQPDMAKTRAEAIEQIREKATNTGKNKPNIFEVKQSSVPRLTTEEQAEVSAELEALAERNASILGGDDAAAKAAEAKKLKLKAQTHYDQALEKIEN
jgi:hypothetical protein